MKIRQLVNKKKLSVMKLIKAKTLQKIVNIGNKTKLWQRV